MLRLLECELRRQCSCHTLSNTNSGSNNCSCSILVDARIGIQSMKHITTTKKKQFGKWSAGRWKYKLSHRLYTHFIYHSLSMSKSKSAHNPQQSRSSHRPTHQLTTQHPARHGPQISPLATSTHRLPRRLSLNKHPRVDMYHITTTKKRKCRNFDQEEDEDQTLTPHPSIHPELTLHVQQECT